MNLASFADELVKVGAAKTLVRKIASSQDVTTIDTPDGMMSASSPPPALTHRPDDASTRVPRAMKTAPMIVSGTLGPVAVAKDPIDREKYNRAYNERR